MQKVNPDQTTMLLPKLNIDDNPIYSVVEPSIENGENSEYSISFQSDLTDGLYSIFGEDDAGNKSIINDEQTFIIDNSQPTLPRIILRNTDSGKSDTDLNTNNTRPEVVFAAEEGLTVYLENITTSTSLQLLFQVLGILVMYIHQKETISFL